MAIDNKYGFVTLEHGTIGEDEPVIVFRARDAVLPVLLGYYHDVCAAAGSPVRHLDLINDSKNKIMQWQEEHGSKLPDSETSREWMES